MARAGARFAWLTAVALLVSGPASGAATADPRFHAPAPDPPQAELPARRPVPAARPGTLADAPVEWRYHKTDDGAHPDGNEQLLVWLMNRARSDPAEEGRRLATTDEPDVAGARSFFEVDLQVLEDEFASYPPRPPAAFDARLYRAAYAHALDLIQRDVQDHQGQFQRIGDAGFRYLNASGSVFSYARSPWQAHAAFNIDWGGGTADGVQPGRGHRVALMAVARNLANMGAAMAPDANPATQVGPWIVVINYAEADPGETGQFNRFVVGTVWSDRNRNGSYDPGEGQEGVRVMLDRGRYYAVTGQAGGYAVPVLAPGDYTVSFLAPDNRVMQTTPIAVGGVSVLVDAIAPRSSAALTLGARAIADGLELSWRGGQPPYQVEASFDLRGWQPLGTLTTSQELTLRPDAPWRYFRVRSEP